MTGDDHGRELVVLARYRSVTVEIVLADLEHVACKEVETLVCNDVIFARLDALDNTRDTVNRRDDDMARIEALEQADRTQVAKAFLNRVEDAGYTPMVYGDKEWLLTMVDMEELQDYEVWFAQDSDEPEYPYEFGMWQYDSDASIKGIKGDAAMIISFKDYAK